MSHDSLTNYYQTNFALINNNAYSLTEIENMIPWERQIYIALLTNHIREENERLERNNNGR